METLKKIFFSRNHPPRNDESSWIIEFPDDVRFQNNKGTVVVWRSLYPGDFARTRACSYHFSRAEALIKSLPTPLSRVVYLNATSWPGLKSRCLRIPFETNLCKLREAFISLQGDCVSVILLDLLRPPSSFFFLAHPVRFLDRVILGIYRATLTLLSKHRA